MGGWCKGGPGWGGTWLIHDIWQKPSQYCNYPPIKINKLKKIKTATTKKSKKLEFYSFAMFMVPWGKYCSQAGQSSEVPGSLMRQEEKMHLGWGGTFTVISRSDGPGWWFRNG